MRCDGSTRRTGDVGQERLVRVDHDQLAQRRLDRPIVPLARTTRASSITRCICSTLCNMLHLSEGVQHATKSHIVFDQLPTFRQTVGA